MKQRILKAALLLTVLIMTKCSDDEKPKTIPEVTTAAVTDFTTTSATVGGEITDDGNADITATGIVYSSTVMVPTVDNDKIELTDTEGDFSTLLEGLSSGTTYHVRAYATNSKGTGYGEVVDFTTGNAAPMATNVLISGQVEVNRLLTATYMYTDSESDDEIGSTFQWYVANDATGTGETAIVGATSLTYTLLSAQQDKYVRFGVTPKAATGSVNGIEVKSAFVGAVGEATTVTFMYNGTSVTYGILNSAATGRKWLDRNLGAPNVPTAVDNYQNYGDLFQWGRRADGHQLINRAGPADADMSGTNGNTLPNFPYEISSTETPAHSKFIISGTGTGDWLDPQNNNLWQGVNGVNNPCPSEWRIATQTEWTAENLADLADAFSKLKLTYTGVHATSDGLFYQSDINGNYWSSTIGTGTPEWAVRIRINAAFATVEQPRGQGYACRCIKD